ncbi:putative phage holin [Paeniglutamicibacter kerguelensis]|uniref:DUF2306 domain-containing protein n=1 Tax=Paeniglutamicibacter kerguelensis TaxID=254788 RepID=A0ABS4XAG8_9MICC|nr:hypothetical protein [Paeniglutamicibacter kerguelensis]MBP2385366.1 hypothetical protein [Paeniglutamicibacter kerguelensis]
MTIQPLTGILVLSACLSTLGVMIGWHVLTRGVWRRHAAGRALMGLLATQSAITALATASSFFPEFPGRAHVCLALNVLLIASVWRIGWTVFREQRRNL